jgi:hypothetical protein
MKMEKSIGTRILMELTLIIISSNHRRAKDPFSKIEEL